MLVDARGQHQAVFLRKEKREELARGKKHQTVQNSAYLDHGDVGEELGDVVGSLRREGRHGHEHLVYDHAQRPQVRRVVVAQVEDELRRQVL